MKVPSISLSQHTSRVSLVSAQKKNHGYFLNRPRAESCTVSRDDRTIKIMLFHQSAAQAMENHVIVTHFTTKIIRTYLYITCNKKILFVKKYLSLLWVFTDFSILLVAAMITDDDDDMIMA